MKLSEYLKNNDVELSDEQVQKLNEVLGVKKSKTWKPTYKEQYYFTNDVGNIIDNCWGNYVCDIERYLLGNVFKSKEDAKFEIEKRKLLVELQRFADENNDIIDWEDGNHNKYSICCNYYNNKFECDYSYTWQGINNIYFSSEELCKYAIRIYGDRIKKYIFGVIK